MKEIAGFRIQGFHSVEDGLKALSERIKDEDGATIMLFTPQGEQIELDKDLNCISVKKADT